MPRSVVFFEPDGRSIGAVNEDAGPILLFDAESPERIHESADTAETRSWAHFLCNAGDQYVIHADVRYIKGDDELQLLIERLNGLSTERIGSLSIGDYTPQQGSGTVVDGTVHAICRCFGEHRESVLVLGVIPSSNSDSSACDFSRSRWFEWQADGVIHDVLVVEDTGYALCTFDDRLRVVKFSMALQSLESDSRLTEIRSE